MGMTLEVILLRRFIGIDLLLFLKLEVVLRIVLSVFTEACAC